MRTAYSVETVRAAERELMARLPDGALMQRAAAGLAAACADLLGRVYGSRVVLLIGSGDNGGDALYAGARLARRGAGVTAVLLTPERAHAGGLAALRRVGGRVAGVDSADELIDRADLVVDGIVGIGGKGGLRAEAAPLASAAERSRAAVVAVDLPSGVDADTGEVRGAAIRADLTVTFGTHKPGLLVDPAREYAGSVRLIDIGLELPAEPELEALQHADVARLLPVPGAESDKYRRGVVGIAAGSSRYPGAAVLAVAGALRGGAGAVRYVGPAGDAVIARFPETLVSDRGPKKAGRVQAWVAGPGAGDDAAAVAEVLAMDVPVLLDADGLRLADRETVRARTAPTLMTPHAGEAAALLGVAREEVEGARLAAVRELAGRYGATVLLKGATTVVADPGSGSAAPGGGSGDGSGGGSRSGSRGGSRSGSRGGSRSGSRGGSAVRVNATGTAWLATAGSGDVLSGLAGSLLAAGLSARDAGSVAAYLHGLAGRFAADGAPAGAHDVAAAIPGAWRDVRE
ncbi:NAD(P)H-hydrate epimerase [Streptomyces dysideae]|uniref:Bifunctional NAD(P)H-hydrate repair enzyme n=1 Tax=Streptomyces dysideae TaxID=909626 RepID=A0A101V269_9ACTN|nr:NAD(P)H-hydrate epimerase [Streptomyces dysideae]KUO21104.1 bifunctional ADP-dependent (S)-NAD(P)H-hydrate dehydratase/NAD(P)H-hydrate epimerase [Streptomyces dysideae]